MASARHHDGGRQFVPGPTDYGEIWLELLSYIGKSSLRPYRLVRERLVARMQAVPDIDRTDKFTEQLKQYENQTREHIPDQEVQLVLWPIIREALPRQFRRPPWISVSQPIPSSRGGSAHTDEDRRDPEEIMSTAGNPPRFTNLHGRYRAYNQPIKRDTVIADLRSTKDPALLGLVADLTSKFGVDSTIPRSYVAGEIQRVLFELMDQCRRSDNMAAFYTRAPAILGLLAAYRAVSITADALISELTALGEPQATDPVVASLRRLPPAEIISFEQVEEILITRLCDMATERAPAGT